ncbi:glycosyltransferase family 2 protein, partial [Ferroplasma acidiphilum]
TNIFEIIDSIQNSHLENYEIIVSYYNEYKYTNEDIILKLNDINNNKMRVVNSKIGSSGGNRNSGARAAVGKYLCFVDDDVTLDNSLFQYIKNSKLQETYIYFPEIKNEIYVPYPLGDHVGGKSYVSACFLISRKAFIEIGYMNEKLNAYRDDSEFFIRATKMGIKLLFMESVYVFHPIRFLKWKTFISIFNKQQYEPLFHKLTSGDYDRVIQKRFISTTANKYGLSIIFYYALVLSIFTFLLLFFSFVYIL